MTTHAERLARWRKDYQGRRTVPGRMLDDAEMLVRWAIEDAERQAAAKTARLEGQLEEARAATERANELADQRIQTLREHRDLLERQVKEKRTIAETRSKEGEEVRVQIAREDWKGWQVADLEEIAYRLRCGGAVDETPVKIDHREASALVPAPDLVKLEDPRAARSKEKVAAILGPVEDGLPDRSAKHEWPTWVKPALALGIGAALAPLVNAVAGWLS